MMFRVVVAGSRDYNDYLKAKKYIEYAISGVKDYCTMVFISGGCRGADMLGERYAKENGYKIARYPADWEKYGRSAGPIRNRKMADISDLVICFWDGKSRGTKSMIDYCRKIGKPIKVKLIS